MTQGWGWGGYLKADNERVASKTTSSTGRGGGGVCACTQAHYCALNHQTCAVRIKPLY